MTRQHYGQERTLRPLLASLIWSRTCIQYAGTENWGISGKYSFPFSGLGLGEEVYDDDDDVDNETRHLVCAGSFVSPRLSHEGLSGVYRS